MSNYRKIERVYFSPTPARDDRIYALCTDGTLWYWSGKQWFALPTVPAEMPKIGLQAYGEGAEDGA